MGAHARGPEADALRRDFPAPTKALEQGAAPKEIILKRQKQFHRRLARRLINTQVRGLRSACSSSTFGYTHADCLSARTHHTQNDDQATGVEDDIDTESHRTEEIQDENGGRRALGQVSSAAASRSGAPRRAAPSASRGQRQRPPTANDMATGQRNSSGFTIFADPEPNHGGYDLDATGTNEGSQWSDLAPTRERTKENVDLARKWNDPSVVASLKGQSSSSSAETRRYANVPAAGNPEADIFVEEEFKDRPDQRGSYRPAPSSTSGASGLTVRQALDRPQTAAEVLLQDPLSYVKQSGRRGGGNDPAASDKQAKVATKAAEEMPASTQAQQVRQGEQEQRASPQESSKGDAPTPSSVPWSQNHSGHLASLLAPDASGCESQFEERRAAKWAKQAAVVNADPQSKAEKPQVQAPDDVTINTATAFKEMQEIFGMDDAGDAGVMWGGGDVPPPTAAGEPLQPLPPSAPMVFSSQVGGASAIESSESPARCMPFALAGPASPSSKGVHRTDLQQTPPPSNPILPPAVIIFDETAASPAGPTGMGGSESQENNLMPPNPARRTLQDVKESSVLQPLPHQPFAAAAVLEGEEIDGDEGPMPEEAEIYRHMQGIATDEDAVQPRETEPSALDFDIYCDGDDSIIDVKPLILESNAAQTSNTIELQMPTSPELGGAGGDGSRRETADPNALMAMLAAFQEEDNSGS